MGASFCNLFNGPSGESIVAGAKAYYGTEISDTIHEAQKTLGDFGETAAKAGWYSQCFGVVSSVTAAVSGACTLYDTVKKGQARNSHQKVGEAIHDELCQMHHALDTSNALQEPKLLSEHIHTFVRSNIKETTGKSDKLNLFFVFHPATNWHREFQVLSRRDPLPDGFCGISHKAEALAVALVLVRKAVGPDAVFNVLLPSAHEYEVRGTLALPASIGAPGHIRLLGEHSDQGTPFVTVTMPVADQVYASEVKCLEPENDQRGSTPLAPAARVPANGKKHAQPRAQSKDGPGSQIPAEISALRQTGAVVTGAVAGVGGAFGGAVLGTTAGPYGSLAGAVTGGAAAGSAAADAVRKAGR